MMRREIVDIQPVSRAAYMRPELGEELESLASGRPAVRALSTSTNRTLSPSTNRALSPSKGDGDGPSTGAGRGTEMSR